jgi:BioD-like phosphotransacetylase family protein
VQADAKAYDEAQDGGGLDHAGVLVALFVWFALSILASMSTLQVLSGQAGSGKSTVVVALAQAMVQAGQSVRIERVGAGDAASQDAETFSHYLFATTSGSPLAQAPTATGGEFLLLELDGGATPLPQLPALVAVHGAPTAADTALAGTLGDRLIGTIAVGVDPEAIEAVARDLTNAGLRPLALIPEDVALSAPSVAEIGEALGATVLFAAENEHEVVDDVLIGPVFSDPARPHFRRYAHKAILAPFNKTDLHLSAIETEAACLVITGGHDPSPYIIDRAHHGNTTLLLSPKDTPGTVASLSSAWSRSRFRGEAKATAAHTALQARLDIPGLLKKLES